MQSRRSWKESPATSIQQSPLPNETSFRLRSQEIGPGQPPAAPHMKFAVLACRSRPFGHERIGVARTKPSSGQDFGDPS